MLERNANGAPSATDVDVLPLLSIKSLAPKLDVYKADKLVRQGGRAIASASAGQNLWLGLKLSDLHEAGSMRPFDREEDSNGWRLPGTSPAEVAPHCIQQESTTTFPSARLLLGAQQTHCRKASSTCEGAD